MTTFQVTEVQKALKGADYPMDGPRLAELATDPFFVEKVHDVVGLYLDPPETAVVLSVDEKSQIQALARSQPAFPMMPGMPENGPTTTRGTAPPACSRP